MRVRLGERCALTLSKRAPREKKQPRQHDESLACDAAARRGVGVRGDPEGARQQASTPLVSAVCSPAERPFAVMPTLEKSDWPSVPALNAGEGAWGEGRERVGFREDTVATRGG